MKKPVTNTPEGALTCDYESRCARVEELQRSNRRVALMALLVAVGLMVASAAYITWSGDYERAPGQQHSSIGFPIDTE
jgi:hypothetical protein